MLFWHFLSFLSSLFLPVCPIYLYYLCPCPPTRDWGSCDLVFLSFPFLFICGHATVQEALFVHPSVRQSVGPPVCWSTSPLIHQSIGRPVCWCVGPLVRRSVGPSFGKHETKSGKTSILESFCVCVRVGRGVGWGAGCGLGLAAPAHPSTTIL